MHAPREESLLLASAQLFLLHTSILKTHINIDKAWGTKSEFANLSYRC